MAYALMMLASAWCLPICTDPWFPLVFEPGVFFNSMIIDQENGNLVMAGETSMSWYSQYSANPAMQMVTTYGVILWARSYSDTTKALRQIYMLRFTPNAQKNIFAQGRTELPNQLIIYKFNYDGDMLWHKAVGDTNIQARRVKSYMDFEIDSNGFIYTNNQFWGSNGQFLTMNQNFFKINPDSDSVVWAWRTNEPSGE